MLPTLIITDYVLIGKLLNSLDFEFKNLDLLDINSSDCSIKSIVIGGDRSFEVEDFILNHCLDGSESKTYEQGVVDGRKQVQDDINTVGGKITPARKERCLLVKGDQIAYDHGVVDGRKQVQDDIDASEKHIAELIIKLNTIKEALNA